MADLQSVIARLYRADWTQLSLSAGVRSERDKDLYLSRVRATRPPGTPDPTVTCFRPDPDSGLPTWEEATSEEPGGYESGQTRLLIAPGGRYRQESADDPPRQVWGHDGQRGWLWYRPDLAPPAWVPVSASDGPPCPELFCPFGLLTGFTLEVRGPVTVGGRHAVAVVVTPRGLEPRLRDGLYDRIEVIMDAELGILLRYEETFGGQRLTLFELTTVTLNPPEADDPGRFAPPAGSHLSEDCGESLRQTFSGPGWQRAKTAAGLAAGGLGALIRFGPYPHVDENDPEAAMPSPEPRPHDPGDETPVPDDLLYLLQRSGEAPVFDATLQGWYDLEAMVARVPDAARAAGHGGVGYLLDALTRGRTVAHTVGRLRFGGQDRYRVDYQSRPGRTHPKTIACDGERRWQVYEAKAMVGPAAPLSGPIAALVDSSWLIGCRLSGAAEITYRGRRAYHFSATRSSGGLPEGPLMFYPADVIADAEIGCLLRLISYAGDRPACWWELRDISTEPTEPGEFRPHIPPGVRTVEETGNPFTDATEVMTGASGYAVRTAAGAVRRTAGAVSATRSFLDDLRGRNRPGGSGPGPGAGPGPGSGSGAGPGPGSGSGSGWPERA